MSGASPASQPDRRNGAQPGGEGCTRSDGAGVASGAITGSAPGAQAQMLEALRAVPAGISARGWVTAWRCALTGLTYNRLDTLVRVTRDANGTVHWSWRRSLPDGARGLPGPGRAWSTAPASCRRAATPVAAAGRLEAVAGKARVGCRGDSGTVCPAEHHPRPSRRRTHSALLANHWAESPCRAGVAGCLDLGLARRADAAGRATPRACCRVLPLTQREDVTSSDVDDSLT